MTLLFEILHEVLCPHFEFDIHGAVSDPYHLGVDAYGIAHMHRGWDTMLDVIDSAAVTPDELSVLCGRPQRVASNETEGWTEDDIWGPQSDPYFKAFRLTVKGSLAWRHAGAYSVNIVTAGAGTAETAHGALELKAGDTFSILGGTASTPISGALEMLVTTPSFV